MTETYGFFASATGDARTYDQAEFSTFFNILYRDGYFSWNSNLGVTAAVPAALAVTVGTGAALIQGYWYENDALITLALAAADPSNPRIDRVVLRLDELAGRTITALVKTGTAAATPVAPTLTRAGGIWEIALADIAVAAGATTISSGNITDDRPDTTLCGPAEPAFVTNNAIYPVGPIDMNGQKIIDLGTPTLATDAATKGYVDTALTGGTVPASFVAGMMLDWGGTYSGLVDLGAAPNGREIYAYGTPVEWLACNGADVSKTTYADLYAAIGDAYGTATDNTVFCLPKATGNVTGYYTAAAVEFAPIGSIHPSSELHVTPGTGTQNVAQWLVVGAKLIKT